MNPTGGPQVNIKTNIDASEATKQITDLMRTATRSIGDMGKAVDTYNRNLQKTLNDLQAITREGANAGQTVRDLSLAGGGTVAGRLRQSNQRARKSEVNQIAEVLTADLVTSMDQIHKKVANSVGAALRLSLARQRQDIASVDAEIRSAQIAAQRARVGFAAQLHGTRGNVRGTITENANVAGVSNLGTLRAEETALNKLLAAEAQFKLQAQQANKELRDQEQYLGRIARLTDQKTEPLRRQIEILQKQNAIERENLRIQQAQQTGNQAQVIKSRLKQEALRLDQMALRGVKEESAEYQGQITKIRQLNAEQQRLNVEKQKGTQATREALALERSREFAAGRGTQAEIARNQMIGGRRNASSLDGRASLLGMQGNLLMNYGLLGGGVAAITGTTAAIIDLDAKLRELQAIAGATNGEFNSLRQVVLKTSEDTKFSAVELAESSVLLAQVGQSAAEIQNTLPVISAFAMAVGTDMKNAVDIVTTSLTVFNMNSAQTQRVTNVLTEALNRSKLSMDQLVLGFQYSANIAADAGVTFEELTAVLAGMSQAGIRSGSMLGTGLRQIMMSLAAPTEKVRDLLSELGLTMNDVDVRTQGLTGVLVNLSEAGLTASQAMGAFETRTAAALVAASNQVNFIQKVQEQFTFTRAAEEAAAKQSESFKNSMLELKNEFLSFMNDAGRPVLQMLITTVKTLKSVGDAIGPLTPVIKALGTAMIVVFGAAMVASVGKLGMAFLSFSGLSLNVAKAVNGLSLAGNMFALSMTAQVGAAARLRLALVALQASVPPLLVISTVAAALVGFGLALRNGTSEADKFKKALDEQRTRMSEAQAGVDSYNQILSQLDSTIARVKDRATMLKDGSNELRLEIMQGASAFNEYGAGIDATNLKLSEYIERLEKAKVAVAALAEAQAAEALKESNKALRTERGGFESTMSQAQSYLGNSYYFGSLKLAPADKALLEKTIADLRKFADRDAASLSTGELSNIASWSKTITDLMTKGGAPAGNLRAIQALGFRASTLNSTMYEQNAAQNQYGSYVAGRSPGFEVLKTSLGDLVKGFHDVQTDLGTIKDNASLSPAQRIVETEALMRQYAGRWRAATAGVDAARATFDKIPHTEAEQIAFDRLMKGTMNDIVSLREAITAMFEQTSTAVTRAIEVIEQQVSNPNLKLSDILADAKTLGLNIPRSVQSRDQLTQWLENRKIDVSRETGLPALFGNVSPMAANIERAQRRNINARGNNAITDLIREKAREAGIDPEYAVRVARIETGGTFNPAIRNPRGTATGLYQFTARTWNGIHPNMAVSTRIGETSADDPRKNAALNIETFLQEQISINKYLAGRLGREIQGWEGYLGWQQGRGGAAALLQASREENAISALSRAYNGDRGQAGRAITQNGGTRDMSVGQFLDLWRGKWAASGQGGLGDTPRRAEDQLQEAANASRKQMETIADGAKTVASTARNLATRTLRNINEFMTQEQGENVAVTVTNALKETEDQTRRYYDLKIQALKEYREKMFAAGVMTQEQADDIASQITDLELARDNDLARVQEDTINTLAKMYRDLPNDVGQIDKAFKEIAEILADLAEAASSSAAQLEVNYQAARERIGSEVDDREVAYGRLSQAEADARAALRARDAREAANRLEPELLANAIARSSAIEARLGTQFGSFGLTMGGITQNRLTQEAQKLASMDQNDPAYARQLAFVNAIRDNLQAANQLRQEQLELTTEIDARLDAMAQSELSFTSRMQTIVSGWAESQGIFKDMTSDLLNGIPNVLDTVQGSFSTFFSDVMTGTASVSDAFRTMATSILKSMMDIVASAAAKQFMRMIVNLGMSLFGGSAPTPMGADTSTLSSMLNRREGGWIYAKTGYGPVRGRDSVPVMAQPGEFVLRKSAVEAIGADNLESLNAAGNRLVSGDAAPRPVNMVSQVIPERPLNVYVVSPDNVPPPSKNDIITWVQEDMINRGPVYKSTKAVQQGAI